MRAGSFPASPSTAMVIGCSGETRPSSTMRTRGRTISLNGTSSPTSRDSVSCTRAMARMRRTDSSIAPLASGDSSRRPCSRNSEEIVCRLFFTRWWISRMVASMEVSNRSRRRSSEMSRMSTRAPVTVPSSSSGRQRTRTVTSGPRSISSVTGAPMAKLVRTATSSRPSSLSFMPSALAWTPMRCSADTAFGEAYSTRPSWSSTTAPSPTRGASSEASSAPKGNSPVVSIRAKRWKTSTYIASSSPD